jgi:hypothetical protein
LLLLVPAIARGRRPTLLHPLLLLLLVGVSLQDPLVGFRVMVATQGIGHLFVAVTT